MIRKLLLGLLFAFAATPALAQNTTCSNRLSTDNSNACANTRFVQSHVPPGFGAGGTNGQIQYNNAGSFGGFTAGGDATINTTTGQVDISKIAGVTVTTTGSTTNDVLAYNGTSYIHTALNSVINTLCTISPTTCVGMFGYGLPQWWGAACDGVTNDAVALQNAINASAGKSLYIPPGTCVTSTTLILPANTTITGARWNSIIKSKVINAPTFSATDVGDIILTNFWIQGTNAANSWTSSNTGAFAYSMDASAPSSLSNIQFTHMKLTSFNSTYWIQFNLSGSTQLLSNVHVDDNLIITDTNSPPTSPVNGESNYVFVFYSGTVTTIRNSTFSRNNINSTGACFGLLFFGGMQYININQNNIQSPGQTATTHCNNSTGTSVNAYGIAVYDLYANGNYAQHYTINGNIISLPYASGIYIVGGSSTANADAIILNNNISGQISTDNASLPRAAIVDNGMNNVIIANNNLNDNWGGIDIAGIIAGQVDVNGNQCSTGNGDTNSHCFRIDGGGTTAYTINLAYNQVNMNTTGPALTLVGSLVGTPFGGISITDNTFRANTNGVLASNQFFSGPFILSGNLFTGTMSSVMAQLRGNSGLITISNNIFDSSGGVSGNGLDVGGSSVAMVNNAFQNRASGTVSMYLGVGACGTMSGTTFRNVIQTAQVAASSLGLTNPSSCTLNYQDFVQNLAPVTPSTVWGWMHVSITASTTHVPLTFP